MKQLESPGARAGRPVHLASIARGGLGGSSVACVEWARAFARRGHTVTVLAPRSAPRRRSAPAGLGFVTTGRGGSRPSIGTALRRLHAARPLDVVQLHDLDGALEEVRAAVESLPGPRPTLVVVAHGTDLEADRDRAGRRLRAAATAVSRWVAPSRALADLGDALLRESTGESRAAFEVISNGVDLDTYVPAPHDRVPETVIHVTNFQPWKDPLLAIDAFRDARERVPELRLRLVGDGPLRAATAERVTAAGLDAHVHWHGRRALDAHDYGRAALVLSTSRRESFGLAVLEGLACGLPAVAPDLPGVGETVGRDEAAGTLVQGRDPRVWGRAIADALADRRIWGARSRAARRRAEEFALDTRVGSWLDPVSAAPKQVRESTTA